MCILYSTSGTYTYFLELDFYQVIPMSQNIRTGLLVIDLHFVILILFKETAIILNHVKLLGRTKIITIFVKPCKNARKHPLFVVLG